MKTRSAKTTSQSRRRFIVGSATVAGGGLALGLPFALDAGSTPLQQRRRPRRFPK
jgi:hypothetical protein